MNVTSTGIAVTLAIVVVLGFFLFGISNPFMTQDAPAVTVPASVMSTNGQDMTTDTQAGTGAEAVEGSTVTLNYVGMFEDGTIFDASEKHGQPLSFTLGAGQVIKGWDQGILGMKVGGKRHLVIPSELGYGPNDYGPIPGGSTLIFDVELLDVK